ncbi:hypothetical protein qu_723 [Acanthamoeba polyphaga mimivirus]|nr:hypothetical protein [Mimivirus reunion]WMV62057.1 hypothetical protein qu_723 [Mimivirus sp.]WMV63034.1 hypothetical protein qu_723 [Acanthamoeba polyphaga mimivirus]WMV64011.1 hypothetical protein qu_723 [Mimivirus sp.]
MWKDNRISEVFIKKKGIGMIALADIPANTLIMKELPISIVKINNQTVSDIFQILYDVLSDPNKKSLFEKFLPNSINEFESHRNNLMKEFHKLKKSRLNNIYQFINNNFTSDEILLYGAKYMCNAFEFNNGSAILINGAKFNHSCVPNVIFVSDENYMYFYTVRNIKTGEELTDNYVDIMSNTKTRKNRLFNQYGFDCQCERCIGSDKLFYQEVEKIQSSKFYFSNQISVNHRKKLQQNSKNLKKIPKKTIKTTPKQLQNKN